MFADHSKMIIGAMIWLILDLPLAWLLGPATVGLFLATKSQPIRTDFFFGNLGRGLLGVAIGSSITQGHIVWMSNHPGLGLGLLIYIILGSGIGFLWLYRFCDWDRSTAWFAAFPGGMSEMIASAEAFGANIPKVALSHALRIFCLICGASVTSYFMADITATSLSFGEVSWNIQPLVLVIVVISIWLGKHLRIPAHSFMTPLFTSLIINLYFDLQLKLNDLFLISAQYFIGWNIASKFKGVTSTEVILILKQVFVLLLLYIPIWVLMALTLNLTTEIDLASIILGLAPGGQAEIALIAIALNANLAVIMVLHVLRSLIITMVGPLTYAIIQRLRR